MIEYDTEERRMVLKFVYYGPALSGKTTNLMRLHDLLAKDGRGDLIVLDTKDDRTIFFDLLPFFLVAPSGLKIKVKVFTVPGQVQHDATRKAVLQRADGVAFIADSRRAESKNNAESFANLERNLAIVGIDVDRLPLVIQYNKRDLPDILPEEEIRRTWGPTGFPVVLSTALEGRGVVETFRALAERAYDALDSRHGFAGTHGLTRESFAERLVRRAG
jgi:signal recognition particle receptor subunit beta